MKMDFKGMLYVSWTTFSIYHIVSAFYTFVLHPSTSVIRIKFIVIVRYIEYIESTYNQSPMVWTATGDPHGMAFDSLYL